MRIHTYCKFCILQYHRDIVLYFCNALNLCPVSRLRSGGLSGGRQLRTSHPCLNHDPLQSSRWIQGSVRRRTYVVGTWINIQKQYIANSLIV